MTQLPWLVLSLARYWSYRLGILVLVSSSSRTEHSQSCVLMLSSSSWFFLFYRVLVLEDRQNSPVLMRTACEDLGCFFLISNFKVPMVLYGFKSTFHPTKHPCTYQHQARRLAVLMRTTCPHEDRIICPRPQGLLQYTVLVLILGLAVLKVLVLVLEDQWTVLVPSLWSYEYTV